MIATKILITKANANLESFEGFDGFALGIVGSERNSFLEDLRFSIQQGWIKNLKNEYWDNETNSIVYEYYSSDLHLTRYFQNYMASKSYFQQGVQKLAEQGWDVSIQTIADKTVIPFADADRIFDEDIEALV